jgi:hydrogenase maturation protein HypF
MGLSGFVKNQSSGVLIEVEGQAWALDRFLEDVVNTSPPLARIGSVSCERRSPQGDRLFRIEPSQHDTSRQVFISPDVATCHDCLSELNDPEDRRYHYPFINCTNCGPRLTIITDAPYDREFTTMADFAMCERCKAEYDNPADRRFHAQPTACPRCGPRLQLLGSDGVAIPTDDPLRQFAAGLVAGEIGAMKGLGGYHLICDARSEKAVAELRRRKQRDEKPLAIMVQQAEAAEVFCEVSSAERTLLESSVVPIVLLRKRDSADIACGVAPGNPYLGVMLPYTPLHHLLLASVNGIPLVMTSGNRSDEPIAYGEDAPVQLGGIADRFLTHNRAIHVRCDDSVTRVVEGSPLLIRRSRGYAPCPISLPVRCPHPILAVGGQLKATFALGRGSEAFLSHHLGDLDHYEAFRQFVKDVDLYQQLFAVDPVVLAHDLHPDYLTTRYAHERARREGKRLHPVQHHYAHMASCMAENGLSEPVIGVTFDGTGYGTDGAIWGGEFLTGDYQAFRRAAHFRYVRMPGGEQAILEPWRMAVAHVLDSGLDFEPLAQRNFTREVSLVARMIERQVNSPLTSSVGRLFDAVASLAGVRDRISFEGQAAMELEWLAEKTDADGVYPYELSTTASGSRDTPLVVDTRPLIRMVAKQAARGVEAPFIARRFHSTLTEIIAAVCARLREATGIEVVVLTGGVFANSLLNRAVSARLTSHRFRVYRHQQVPPGDGGLCLGQLAVTAAAC